MRKIWHNRANPRSVGAPTTSLKQRRTRVNLEDFSKAEYVETESASVPDEAVHDEPGRQHLAAFPLAILYGVGAALVGALGYALVGLTGFMVSIVTVAIGWLVARAMMTATHGVGGQEYQIAAVALTYFSANLGRILNILYEASKNGVSPAQISLVFYIKWAFFAPFVRLQDNLGWGLMGLLVLFYGLRTAWQLAAGAPGFGQAGGAGFGFGGVRR